MPSASINSWKPGDRLSAKRLNAEAAEIDRLGKIRMIGGIVVQSSAGVNLIPSPPLVEGWAEITADNGDGTYAFKFVVPGAYGSFNDISPTMPSVPANNPAYNVAGVTLTVGAVVWIRQGYARVQDQSGSGNEGEIIQEWLIEACCSVVNSGNYSGG